MTTEQQEPPAEINVFVRTPDGYDAHVKLTTTASKSVGRLSALSKALAEAGFMASQRGASSPTTGPACPKHPDRTRPSKHEPNGYFCSHRDDDGRYCDWSFSPKKGA